MTRDGKRKNSTRVVGVQRPHVAATRLDGAELAELHRLMATRGEDAAAVLRAGLEALSRSRS